MRTRKYLEPSDNNQLLGIPGTRGLCNMLKGFYKNILFNVKALRLLNNKSKYTGLLMKNFIVVELCVFDGNET